MNRNRAIKDFLESDATHLLFVEDERGKVHTLHRKVKKE